MVMILSPPLPLLFLFLSLPLSTRIWIHPSKTAAARPERLSSSSGPVQKVRGLICAVPSSMPDKSMCQHLFLCCQFFMVFDDISPIVRPATHAVCSWPVCLPLASRLPIWLNRPDIAPWSLSLSWSWSSAWLGLARIGVSSCWHGHRSALFVWPLAQELWVPPPWPFLPANDGNISSDFRHPRALQLDQFQWRNV